MIDRPESSGLAAPPGADVTLVLPDGATRSVPAGTLPSEVVRSIGERLLMAAVAVSVDGENQDLMTPLRKGGAF
jgi:threonyl-tRNA synthetase